MPVSPIPAGYRSVTPYLICRGAAQAIRFYEQAFEARERMRLAMPDGKIAHAELQIGDAVVMLADEAEAWGALGPQAIGGTPVSILVYVEDVDQVYQRALELGAKVIKPLANQFYGDRSGHIEDPFGHRWSVATHIEDVSLEEMQRRMSQLGG